MTALALILLFIVSVIDNRLSHGAPDHAVKDAAVTFTVGEDLQPVDVRGDASLIQKENPNAEIINAAPWNSRLWGGR